MEKSHPHENHVAMNYEDRLQQAKQDKSLSDAPMLRRAILRTRWFGLIGGTILILAAIRGIVVGVDVLDDTAVPLVIAIVGAVIAVGVFVLSRMTNSAAKRYDMTQLSNALGRLKTFLIAQLILVVSSAVYTVVILSDTEINPLPYLLPSVLSFMILLMWMLDIDKGRAEIKLLVGNAFNSPVTESTSTPTRPAGSKLRFFSWMIAVSGIGSALASGLFWYLASYHLDWFTENFSGKPIGWIEPYEAYEQFRTQRGDSLLWDEWIADLTADGTIQPDHHSYETETSDVAESPYPEDTSSLDSFSYNHGPEIYKILNRRIFFFDFAAYLILFSLLFLVYRALRKTMQLH